MSLITVMCKEGSLVHTELCFHSCTLPYLRGNAAGYMTYSKLVEFMMGSYDREAAGTVEGAAVRKGDEIRTGREEACYEDDRPASTRSCGSGGRQPPVPDENATATAMMRKLSVNDEVRVCTQ